MNVSVPPALREWVDQQVASGGYGTASRFVSDLLRRARLSEFQLRMDPLLVEAMESGATHEMNAADWAEIRAAARAGGKKTRRRLPK